MDDTEVQLSTAIIEGDVTDVVHVRTIDAYGLDVGFELTVDNAAELGDLLQQAVA